MRQNHHPRIEILYFGTAYFDVRGLRRLHIHAHPIQTQLLPAQQIFCTGHGYRLRTLHSLVGKHISCHGLHMHIVHPALALQLQLRPFQLLRVLDITVKAGQSPHQTHIQIRRHVGLKGLQRQGFDMHAAFGEQRIQLKAAFIRQRTRFAPTTTACALSHLC
ncbi:hypothetical protein D3C72_1658220 [compost metagenome]